LLRRKPARASLLLLLPLLRVLTFVLRTQHLAALGYKQELKRNVTFMGSVGITLGCMQARACWKAKAHSWPRVAESHQLLTRRLPRSAVAKTAVAVLWRVLRACPRPVFRPAAPQA